VVEHLGKLCWLGGGLLLLLGVLLAVLTVELAADPDKWPGRSEAVLAAAQRMFRVTSAGGGLEGGEGASSSGHGGGGAVAGHSSSGAAGSSAGVGAAGLREPLLQPATGQQQAEIVAE